ncbi:MAG: hypothetical protein H6602_09230 [Flavobacteriales bacterium]|nr:hypothetical protein [Flavobacteriales bacterium]
MEAIFATLTDKQRVETLNNVYQKGITTPAEALAFSADKLVYLKPFISKLMTQDYLEDLTSRMMTRQIVYELLAEIVDEVTLTCSRKGNATLAKVASDYGIKAIVDLGSKTNYELKKVA